MHAVTTISSITSTVKPGECRVSGYIVWVGLTYASSSASSTLPAAAHGAAGALAHVDFANMDVD